MKKFLVLIATVSLAWTLGLELAAAERKSPRTKTLRSIESDVEKHRYRKQPRIIGGVPATFGDAPWQVAIVRRSSAPGAVPQIHCGGAFIRPTIIMTAAHCVAGSIYGRMSGYVVLNGDADLTGPQMRRYDITDAFVHPRYNAENIDYDFALLQVKQSYTGPLAQIISPEENAAFNVGDAVMVSGWGVVNTQTNETSRKLQKVALKVVGRSDCSDPNSYGKKITDQMLCAGFPDGGKDACQGDSGGPLTMRPAGGGVRLAGVVSWGEGCAKPNKYGVFGRLIAARDWVQSATELLESGRLSGPEIAASTSRTKKIKGGKDVPKGKMPWQAVLLYKASPPPPSINDQVACGATFIDRDTLMTAAHCIENTVMGSPHRFAILNGDGAVKLDDRDMTSYTITDVVAHPRYDGETFDYDFAILRVADIRMAHPLRIVSQAENDQLRVGSALTVSGWGLDNNNKVPTNLQELDVGVISRAQCNSKEVYNGDVTPRMLCAGYLKAGKDSCQGDSGGPLTLAVPGSEQPRLVGVVSWGGDVCGAENKPGVYGRLIAVRDWVEGAVRLLGTIR